MTSLITVEPVKDDTLKDVLAANPHVSPQCICSTWHLFPNLSAENLNILVRGLKSGNMIAPDFTYVRDTMVHNEPSSLAWCNSFRALGSPEAQVRDRLRFALSEGVQSAYWDHFLCAWVLH